MIIHYLYDHFLSQRDLETKSYIHRWIQWRLFRLLRLLLPFYYRNKSLKNLGKYSQEHECVITLTSFPERIHIVYLTIKSILNQTVKPKKVTLYLGQEKFPGKLTDLPVNLTDLMDYGLEIKFREDLKPHTKYYYGFKENANQIHITVDDDLIYPKNMVEKLLKFHKKYPKVVIANRVRSLSIIDGKLSPYRTWKINQVKHSNPSFSLLATGVGGVLYNPKYFSSKLHQKNLIKEMALNADDIWLKANQLYSKIPVVFTNYFYRPFIEIPGSQTINLHSTNVFEADNDIQIQKIFKLFGIDEEFIENLE